MGAAAPLTQHRHAGSALSGSPWNALGAVRESLFQSKLRHQAPFAALSVIGAISRGGKGSSFMQKEARGASNMPSAVAEHLLVSSSTSNP